MEQSKIRALLDKYWKAETSVEEERALAEFFRQPEIPGDLEPVRGLFQWREEEAELRPGAGFDRRMLERIEGMESEGGGGERVRGEVMSVGMVVRGFSIRFAAAAAIILCLGIGLLIPMISPGPGQGGPGSAGGGVPVAEVAPAAAVKDTYTDPNKALAVVRRALLVASVRLNEGNHITQRNITRLHDSWQAVTGD
jgi:hypothetical protein